MSNNFFKAVDEVSSNKELTPTISIDGNYVIGTPVMFKKVTIDTEKAKSAKYPDVTISFKGSSDSNDGFISDRIFGNTFDETDEKYNKFADEKYSKFVMQFLMGYIPKEDFNKGIAIMQQLIEAGDNSWLALVKAFFSKEGVFKAEFAATLKGELAVVLKYNEKNFEIKKDKFAKVFSTELLPQVINIPINEYTKVKPTTPDSEEEPDPFNGNPPEMTKSDDDPLPF